MAPTFADVVPLKQLASHQYSIFLDNDWSIGIVPNGGYVTSSFLIVARTHMALTHSARSETNPMNLHLEFLRRTSAGPARFRVRDVKLGARISNLHLVLSQEQEDGRWQDEVEGYVTMTNIAQETGLSLETAYTMYPPTLPVDLKTLGATGQDTNWMIRAKDPFRQFRRAAQNIQMHLIKPERRPPDRPKSIVDQWVRFAPGGRPNGRWTNDALGFLVDMFPQIVESYVNPVGEDAAIGTCNPGDLKPIIQETEARAKYWYPTLALNLDVKKLLPEDGVEWLFVRVKAKVIRNGRLDLDVEVWDEQRELVATSQHASLIVDASRNTTRNRKVTKL